MPQTALVTIGAQAVCTDGPCGDVSRVVIDPVDRVVTHAIVEPTHHSGPARLVPLDLLDVEGETVHLRCTLGEFERLDRAEETDFLPGSEAFDGYQPDQAYYRPYYRLGLGDQFGPTGGMNPVFGSGGAPRPVVYESIPAGEVSIRRGEHVHAKDGSIGKVQGLVIDPFNHHVTHILLQEGHFWGTKEVTIPIAAVTRVDDGISVDLTKEQVENLPRSASVKPHREDR